MQLIGFYLFLAFEKFLMVLPHSFRKSFFFSLAHLGYLFSKRYKTVAYQNLNFAFEDRLSEEEKTAIVKYGFKNLALNFLHVMEIRHMSKEELAKRVTIQNIEVIQKVREQNRPIIYITPHYSSWELAGSSIGALINPAIAVYKKMKKATFQEWLLESRSHFGNISVEKTNVVRPLIKYLKKGYTPAFLIDTNINQREGVLVNFMGRTIRQTSTPAYLARKFDAAIIPGIIRTDDEENFTIILFDEIPVEKTDDELSDIQKSTQLQADWLTSIITKEPKFWFWLHRRWKNDHPEIYEKN
ncbi:lipid A biosynthesis lauroyl acyltransferase [Sulfurimonas sp.]|uniref:lipid A biosynthesis lauroyl acyltransferase n=1 Tax=Sulfurimonas sp. TaxID=2022749 RepID=UPI003D0A8449